MPLNTYWVIMEILFPANLTAHNIRLTASFPRQPG